MLKGEEKRQLGGDLADRKVRDVGQPQSPGVLFLKDGRLGWGQVVGKGNVFKVGKREER